MKDYARSDRLASQIQRELAGLLRGALKDPGLGTPSVLEVRVSKDLSHARVYFSLLDPAQAEDCLAALGRAAGFLQREIGKSLQARVTPKLSFHYDDTDIRGRQLSDLIDAAVASDKSRAGE